MEVSLEIGDKVFYRGGKTPWTIVELPIESEGRWASYKLINPTGDKRKSADENELSLILQIETKGSFKVVVQCSSLSLD